jgi:hypothetical protein
VKCKRFENIVASYDAIGPSTHMSIKTRRRPTRPPAAMRKQQHHRQRRRNTNKGPRSSPEGCRSNSDDRQSGGGGGNNTIEQEIIAQLQLQRKKHARQLLREESVAATIATSQGTREDPSTYGLDGSRKVEKRRRSTPECERSVMGNFRYDPTLKRYFPKSAFAATDKNNNDACILRIRKRISTPKNEHDGCIVDARNLISEKGPLHGGIVSNGDMRRIAFRGTCLPNDKVFHIEQCASYSSPSHDQKRKKLLANEIDANILPPFPCSERTKLLLTTSLEYCTTSTRRNAIVSRMLGPMSIARKATMTPTLSTLEMLRNETKKSTHLYTNRRCDGRPIQPFYAWRVHASKSREWFSMLHPLRSSQGLQP